MTEPSLKLPSDPDPDFDEGDNTGPLEPATSLSGLIKLGIATLVVIGISFAGQIATMKGLDPWYFSLKKAPLNPPPTVFPIAWTLLYGLMAWALWRLLRLRDGSAGRSAALLAFGIQLVLNALWSWAFFGAQSPLAGLLVIAALNIVILRMIVSLWQVDAPAALSQTPYALWVLFATYLNAGVWWLNR